jgi:ABC-2 type transport system permease protein
MTFLPIARTALVALRRDRAALALSFILPISFFSIFAVIFGSHRNAIPRISAIVVDADQSAASRQLVQALQSEGSLIVITKPQSKKNQPEPADYTAATAEAAIKAGDASIALIIPQGWGANPISFRPDQGQSAPTLELLNDASDMIAPQVMSGLLQKAAMTAMPLTMAEQGMKYSGQYIGGFTPQQRAQVDANLDKLRQLEAQRAADAAKPNASQASSAPANSGFSGIIAVHNRSVVGENKNNPMISFYAAAIGVMFLLFTASGSAGALLDEAESGTLDRVLSSRISMTGLLAGKLFFNTLLAFIQLTAMFLWAWSVFKLDFFSHIPGFIVMGLCTAVAVGAFGILLASICHTRAQLGAVSTLVILIMSSIGGSMFPRYLMPESMQKAGLFTINAWAIDGFTKVFWRDLPVSALWPQVSVLLSVAIVLFLIARRVARRWEYA